MWSRQRTGLPTACACHATSKAQLLSTFDELSAVARARNGDAAAFNELISHHQGLAYSLAYRTLQDEAAALDALQDSFLKAYRALHQFHGGSFKSWLMRIVVNTCYDVLRSSRHRLTDSLDDLPVDEDHAVQLVDPGASPQDYVEQVELNGWIEAGIKALPDDQRLVLVLCDVHGYTYDEIAEVVGLPMGTVKSRLSRARGRLRDYLLRRPELLPASFRPNHE